MFHAVDLQKIVHRLQLSRQLAHARAALALLTRLVSPSANTSTDELIAAVPWYPVAGLAVGLVAVVPLFLGLGSGYPFVQAWLYLCISLWSTRCLHWDGLADLADAWGSNAHGPRFQEILKDSRIGAFGALALALGVLGYSLLAAPLCADTNWPALILVPVTGRVTALLLAVCAPLHIASTLGRLLADGATVRMAASYALLVCAAVLCLLGWKALVLLAAGQVLIIVCLTRLAKREQGLNGDFFGAAIILGELAALFCFLA